LKHLSQSSRLVRELKRKAIKEIHSTSNERRILQARKEFYGRAKSVLMNAGNSLDLASEARKSLGRLPRIDFSLPTIILAGYPNTGKSTILARITKAKPMIAEYPFTTKGLNLGYFEFRYRKIQVIDTPGLLDRPLEKRNKIELQAVHALDYLADLILFIFDASSSRSYSAEDQLSLLKQIAGKFRARIAVIVNKADLLEEIGLTDARKKLDEVIPGVKIFLSGKGLQEEKLMNEVIGFLEEKGLLDKAKAF
jgi:nucleolar GTP-binding protein